MLSRAGSNDVLRWLSDVWHDAPEPAAVDPDVTLAEADVASRAAIRTTVLVIPVAALAFAGLAWHATRRYPAVDAFWRAMLRRLSGPTDARTSGEHAELLPQPWDENRAADMPRRVATTGAAARDRQRARVSERLRSKALNSQPTHGACQPARRL